MKFSGKYYHWFILIQPTSPLGPVINIDPDTFRHIKTGSGCAHLRPFSRETRTKYLRSLRDPETFHASCEDVRAAARIDLDHDYVVETSGRKVSCPFVVLWGKQIVVNSCFKPIDVRIKVALAVCGHVYLQVSTLPGNFPTGLYGTYSRLLMGS